MKKIGLALLAAASLAAAAPQPAMAACQALSTGMQLKRPGIGDPFDVWAACIREMVSQVNSSAAYTTASATTTAFHFGDIYVSRIGGRNIGTPGVRLSSAVFQDAGFYFVTDSSMAVRGAGGLVVQYGVNAATVVAQGVTTSSANVTGSGGLNVAHGATVGYLAVVGSATVVDVFASGYVRASSFTLVGSADSGLSYDSTGDGNVLVISKGGISYMLDSDNNDNMLAEWYKNSRTPGGGTLLCSIDQSGNFDCIGNVSADNDIIAGDDVDAGDDGRFGDQGIFGGTVTVKGNAFSVGTSTLIVLNGGVGVSTTNVPTSVVLFTSDVRKGVLFNPMSSAQRDAIVSPAQGLLIYNTSTGKYNFYNGAWTEVGGGGTGDVSSNGNNNFTGENSFPSKSKTETPTANMTYREMLPKAWVVFTGTGTVTLQDAFNVSSITDNGNGDYTVNFLTPCASDYIVSLANAIEGASGNYGCRPISMTTSSVRLQCINSASTLVDMNRVTAAFFCRQ